MEIGKLIKKTLVATCVWFTAINAAYMLILQFINVGEDSVAVEAFRVVLFFLFALLFSIANTIRATKSIHSLLRNITHYVISAFAFYTCFLLPDNSMRSSTMITGLVVFTVVYVIIAGCIAIFKGVLSTNREKSMEYTKQFNKK